MISRTAPTAADSMGPHSPGISHTATSPGFKSLLQMRGAPAPAETSPRKPAVDTKKCRGTEAVLESNTAPAVRPGLAQVPLLKKDAPLTRVDFAAVAMVARVMETVHIVRRDLCVTVDTGTGPVAIRVVPDRGSLRVEITPDPRVPHAVRCAIADAVRRKAPGAEIREHARRQR